MNDLDMAAEMRAVLAKLEVVSHGTTSSYSVVSSKGGFGDREGGDGRPPGGMTRPPHEHWAAEWNAAKDDAGRLAALEGATDELDGLTRRTLPDGFQEKPELPHERTGRILHSGDGVPLQEAATRLNVAPRELVRIRRAAGRDPYTGTAIETTTSADDRNTRRQRVRDLKDRHPGMSNRQIADVVGCDHKTVAADLERSAA